jgi:ferredoxin-type protein NapH
MTFSNIRNGLATLIILGIGIGALLRIQTGSMCYLHVGMAWLVCPIGFIELSINSRTIYWNLLPFVMVAIIIGLLLGRVFCSWMCPVIFIGNWVDKLFLAAMPSFMNRWRIGLGMIIDRHVPKLTYKDGIALLAGSLVGISIFQYPFLSIFCPIGVVTRNIISLFSHLSVSADVLLLLIPLLGGVFFVGGWRACCPTGLFHGLSAKTNCVFVPTVDGTKCAHCGICDKICPVGLQLGRGVYEKALCTKCFNCVDACPNKAVQLKSR